MKTEMFLEKVEKYIVSLREKIGSLLGSSTQEPVESLRHLEYPKDEASEDQGAPKRELDPFKYLFEEEEETH